jgi:hypothetical protein
MEGYTLCMTVLQYTKSALASVSFPSNNCKMSIAKCKVSKDVVEHVAHRGKPGVRVTRTIEERIKTHEPPKKHNIL